MTASFPMLLQSTLLRILPAIAMPIMAPASATRMIAALIPPLPTMMATAIATAARTTASLPMDSHLTFAMI